MSSAKSHKTKVEAACKFCRELSLMRSNQIFCSDSCRSKYRHLKLADELTTLRAMHKEVPA